MARARSDFSAAAQLNVSENLPLCSERLVTSAPGVMLNTL